MLSNEPLAHNVYRAIINEEKMKILYFVRPEDLTIPEDEIIRTLASPSEYKPNFLLIDEKRKTNTQNNNIDINIAQSFIKESIASNLSKGAVRALASTGVPGAIILGSAWLGNSAYDYFSNKSNAAESEEENSFIEKDSVNFIRDNAITQRIASFLEYKFPPGHPRISRAYILHPLASDEKDQYHNLFIPYEKYDEILYEERESELIRLLVDLGATKIVIKDVNISLRFFNVGAECEIEMLNKSGGINADVSKKGINTNGIERVFELVGKVFNQDDEIEKAKFKWLKFEPSWNSIVVARYIGKCKKAEMILKQKTSFSAEISSETAIKMAVASGKINMKHADILDDDKQYMISVDFGDVSIKEQ
jgi:hypothetical protein